jgi:hypothetical protein
MDNGRQCRHARLEIFGARPDDVVGSHQGRRTSAAPWTSSHNGRIRFGDVDRRPLAAPTAKERFMHNPQDPSRITNSYPYKTPAERVHDSDGRFHDETTNSPSPMRGGSADSAKCQLKGFMVPGSRVHDCRIAATIAGPAQLELNTAPSSVRSLAPSMRRTSGEPTAAERRPECRALPGIALHSPPPYLVGKVFGYLAQPTNPRYHRCQSSSSAPPLWHQSVPHRSNTKERWRARRAHCFSRQRDDHEGRRAS